MADNFTFTQGSGATGAADLIDDILFPRVKLIKGADGVNDGDISSSNPLPVELLSLITVNQGSTPWNSLGTVTVANTITLTGNVTVQQGTTPWLSLGTQTLANGVGNIGFATVTPSNTARTISANVTVQQGSTPWNSLGTTTLASGVGNIGFATVTPSNTTRSISGNVTVSMPGGVTVYQGNQPWTSLGTQTLANGVGNIGFATVTPSNTSRSIVGNVTVSMPGGVTVYQGTQPWNSLGTVTLGAAGATIYAVVNTTGGSSNVTLNPSPNFIGLVTVANSVNLGASSATIYAVVNTGAVGVTNSIVTVANPITLSSNVTATMPGGVTVYQGTQPWNSLGTVTLGAAGATIYAVVNTGAAGVQNSMVTIYPRTDYIGLVSISGNVVNSASAAYIGLVSVNIGGSLPAGVNGIGFATVAQGSTPWNSLGTATLASGIGNIGFATITPSTTVRSITGNVTVQQGTTPWSSLGTVTLAASAGYVGLVTVVGNVGIVPTTSGGCSIFRSIDVDETEEEVHGAAGQIYGYFLANTNATVARYVKFYNATAGNTSVGVNTPIITVPLQAQQAANVSFPQGITFATALSVAATTAIADSDVGAPATNDIVANIFYK